MKHLATLLLLLSLAGDSFAADPPLVMVPRVSVDAILTGLDRIPAWHSSVKFLRSQQKPPRPGEMDPCDADWLREARKAIRDYQWRNP